MNVEKLIELNKANQSYSVKVNKSIKSKDNILTSVTRIDKPNDLIRVESLDNNGERLDKSVITIAKNNEVVWQGNFDQLAQNLTD